MISSMSMNAAVSSHPKPRGYRGILSGEIGKCEVLSLRGYDRSIRSGSHWRSCQSMLGSSVLLGFLRQCSASYGGSAGSSCTAKSGGWMRRSSGRAECLDTLAKMIGQFVLPQAAAGCTLEPQVDRKIAIGNGFPNMDEVLVDFDNFGTTVQQRSETDEIVRSTRRVADVLDASIAAESQAALLTDDCVMPGGSVHREGIDLPFPLEERGVEDDMLRCS